MALSSGVQEHVDVGRHRIRNPKLLVHAPDAFVPLLPGCGRMRVAREIYVGQDRINLPNLPQEVEVCQPVGRLVHVNGYTNLNSISRAHFQSPAEGVQITAFHRLPSLRVLKSTLAPHRSVYGGDRDADHFAPRHH